MTSSINITALSGEQIYDLRERLNEIASTAGQVESSILNKEGDSSEFTLPQMKVIALLSDELISNVRYGLIPKETLGKIEEEIAKMRGRSAEEKQKELMIEEYNVTFKRARDTGHKEPFVHLTININPEGNGEVKVTHPFVKGRTSLLENGLSIGLETHGATYPCTWGY